MYQDVEEQNTLTDKDVGSVSFFHDFIVFLKYLEKQPIKRTITGNISLNDINNLRKQFRLKTEFDKIMQEMGWQIRTEGNVQYLTQMKIIAEVMYLTYKRKNKLLISKNGKGFLTNLNPLNQYIQMVLHYWYKVNWGYFSPGREINGMMLSEVLQKHQDQIWKSLLHKGHAWIDFEKFCKALEAYFHLEPYFKDEYYNDPKHFLLLDINLSLLERNLLRFGCVEVEEKKKDWSKEIVRFRMTPLGLFVLEKAIYENYL